MLKTEGRDYSEKVLSHPLHIRSFRPLILGL